MNEELCTIMPKPTTDLRFNSLQGHFLRHNAVELTAVLQVRTPHIGAVAQSTQCHRVTNLKSNTNCVTPCLNDNLGYKRCSTVHQQRKIGLGAMRCRSHVLRRRKNDLTYYADERMISRTTPTKERSHILRRRRTDLTYYAHERKISRTTPTKD